MKRSCGAGARIAGVQLRTRRIPDHHEVIGYQADVGDPELQIHGGGPGAAAYKHATLEELP